MIARILIPPFAVAVFLVLLTNVDGAAKPVPVALSERLDAVIRAHDGMVGVEVKHLPTGETYQYDADRRMPTASLIKFPILVTAYHEVARDEMEWSRRVTLTDADKVPGSGVLTDNFSDGTMLSLRDAARLMIVFSDNTATNLLIDAVGIRRTTQYMDEIGLPNTRLNSKVYRRDLSISPKSSDEFGLGSTTAHEMAVLFDRLWSNTLVSPEACVEMKKDLFACRDRTKIARGLPRGVRFAHKTGEVSQSRCDAGVIDGPAGPTIVCVLTTKNADQEYDDNNKAHLLCGEIGRLVFSHFHASRDDSRHSRITLKNGDAGSLVRSLQRTLNKRLTPSPKLSLDGDFGPATESAVKRFQTSRGLAGTGRVDDATWKALGPLETKDIPPPPPEVVNAEVQATESADRRTGVPFVTCKAWAMLDADSGDFIGGDRADEALDMASTTKIMTSLVALNCCEQDPSLLAATVTFSKRADETRGSTSDIAAGEQVRVQDLLYALLLPSGNDASVAIAEFFGRYVGNETLPELSDQESYDRFIQAMNDASTSLAANATFTNPHGLTAPGHKASARGLAKIAHRAIQYDLFRTIVASHQRGCTLTSTSGYSRNVVWKNTNRLLGIEGYYGVKTGTTDAAGACLVSYGKRDRHDLITVVLGSTGSDARYVDTRNLFRWGWNQVLNGQEK